MNKKGKPQRGRSLFPQLMGRLRKAVQALRKMGCPCYRRTPRTLPRPLATLVTLASIQLASGGLQGCRLVELMARFPLPRACDRCGFGERTFAGTRGSDGNAPIPAIQHRTVEQHII